MGQTGNIVIKLIREY